MDQKKYALGFLKGRADGFRRRSLTTVHVEAAAKLASRSGVADDEIATLLSGYGLAWDSSSARVMTIGADQRAK